MIRGHFAEELPVGRVQRGLRVGHWSADLLCDRPRADVDLRSGAVLRLAEDLACSSRELNPGSVRVAALPPSGRPVATVAGEPARFTVSVSHVRGLVGAVLSDDAWVGIDIVDPGDAGRALDVWFTPDERSLLPDDHGLLRAMLWAAKEAAYKAARLDTEFRPRAVTIDQMTPRSFAWSAHDGHAEAVGDGCFGMAGRHLIAVAATPIRGATARGTRAVLPTTESTSFNHGASA